ncbi:hypothetical protein ACFOGG_13370 [Brenneria rubrifaciens]|uniref:hypothetical protein n=1 Tax=Brenneria rubrifaciens TaxID=55213 RepID=UPI003605AACE
MSATSTEAPCAASSSAIARPMPDPPPVTTAVIPCNCNEDTFYLHIDDSEIRPGTRATVKAA